MADILFYLAAYGVEKMNKKLHDARSPLIPLPPPPPSPPRTEQDVELDLAPVYTREPVANPVICSVSSVGEDDDRRTSSSSSSPHWPVLSRSTSAHPPTTTRPTRRARSRSQQEAPQTAAAVVPLLLTEHKLRECHVAWRIRYQSLFLRLATLLDALKRGLRNSWAGHVSWDRCDQVRLAILEAEFVMNQLGKAVEWCDDKGLERLPLVALVKGKRRSSVSRPTHSSCPPSLALLPSPLPEAPPAISTRLTVALPPWVFRPELSRPADTLVGTANDEDEAWTPEDASVALAPPLRPPEYTRHYDPFKGERVIERARWNDDRVPDGADQVVLIR